MRVARAWHASQRLFEASVPLRHRRDAATAITTRNFTQERLSSIFKGNVVHQVVRPVRHLQLEPVQVGREHELTTETTVLARLVREIKHV